MNTIQNVSDTALWVAYYRGVESARPDAVFHDPLASKLAGDRGREIAHDMPQGQITGWMMVPRTTLIDRYVREVVAAGADLIINLGTGLDTRPYRMDLPPALEWVEVDFPNMISYKNEMLAHDVPKCKLRRVAVDLGAAEERRKFLKEVCAGRKKIAVITEGVIPYLTNTQATDLANDLHHQPNIEFWIQDCYAAKSLEYMRSMKKLENAPMQFAPTDWFEFFAKLGWKRKDYVQLQVESQRLGRKLVLPLTLKVIAFISAKARSYIRDASGCTVLIRK